VQPPLEVNVHSASHELTPHVCKAVMMLIAPALFAAVISAEHSENVHETSLIEQLLMTH
jgi:hypothetical protein